MNRTDAELLVDISNSFTKMALSRGGVLGQRWRIRTAGLEQGRMEAIVRRHPIRRCILSSVVPQADLLFKQVFKKQLLRLHPDLNLGVAIDYPRPASIGQDRLANAAGVVACYRAPAIVVDFGTAVTFDLIDPRPAYVGGVIAPGLEVMTSYLHERTALLPKIDLQEPVSIIGKSTRQAMLAGAIHGYRGLVAGILHEVQQEAKWKKPLQIVFTGGYAQLIAKGMQSEPVVDADLTLKGLATIAALNP